MSEQDCQMPTDFVVVPDEVVTPEGLAEFAERVRAGLPARTHGRRAVRRNR